MNKKEIKAKVKEITGNTIRIREFKNQFVISNGGSHIDNGFGYYKEQLNAIYNIGRLDGGSFTIIK